VRLRTGTCVSKTLVFLHLITLPLIVSYDRLFACKQILQFISEFPENSECEKVEIIPAQLDYVEEWHKKRARK